MSTAQTIYPYNRVETVELVIRAASEADTLEELRNVRQDPDVGYGPKVMDLTDAGPAWSAVRLDVVLSIQPSALASVLLDGEAPEEVVAGVVSLTCSKTKYRKGFRLQFDGTRNEWTGSLLILRSEVRGIVELQPLLIRSSTAVQTDPDCATFAGAIIGQGRETRLVVDRSAKVYRDDFRYTWVEFARSGHVWLEQRSNDVVYAEPGVTPHIFLNLGWPLLQQILEAHDRDSQPLKQAYGALIRHTVWIQLLMTAVSSIHNSEDEWHVAGEPWRADLVSMIANQLDPGRDEQEQLKALRERFVDPYGLSELIAQVTSLAHDQSEAGKLLNEAASALQRSVSIPASESSNA